MSAKSSTKLIGVTHDFNDGPDGLIIAHSQEISDDFLKRTAHYRNNPRQIEGEFMHVCDIPVVFVEKWIREGFDILNDRNITIKDIVDRLKREGLEAFLTTPKRV